MSNHPGPDNGQARAIDVLVGAFFGIAIYNSLEVYILVLNTFRRKNTMYFWTILLSNLGIPMQLLYMFHIWGLAPNLPMAVFTSLGWILMSTGQPIILYLRLHLVIHERRKLRWILSLIVLTFITLQIPAAVSFLALCAYPPGSGKGLKFKSAFDVLKVAQLVGFLIQEAVISGTYVYAFHRTSQRLRMVREDQVNKMLRELIALAILVVLFDIALVVDEVVGNYEVQTALRPAVYSVKLKAELFVLNNLVNWMQPPPSSSASGASNLHPRKPATLDRLSSGHTLMSEAKSHPHHVPSHVSSRAPSCVPSRTATPDQRPATPVKSVSTAETEERPFQRNGSQVSPHSMVASEPRALTGSGVKPGGYGMPSFEKIDLGD